MSFVIFMSGSLINILSNLLIKALSFVKYLSYSSKVVAPIIFSIPLDKYGFNILAASMAPSEPPAFNIVCISSINNIVFLFSIVSFIIVFNLLSKSPLYLLPANTKDISILNIL